MKNIAIAIFCLFYQCHFMLQLAEKDNTTSNFLPCDYSIDVITAGCLLCTMKNATYILDFFHFSGGMLMISPYDFRLRQRRACSG